MAMATARGVTMLYSQFYIPTSVLTRPGSWVEGKYPIFEVMIDVDIQYCHAQSVLIFKLIQCLH